MELKLALFKNTCVAIFTAILMMIGASASAGETLKPFVLAYSTPQAMESIVTDVRTKLESAGFNIVGEYSPYEGAMIIVVTNSDLLAAAASSEYGGYTAGQRVTLTKVGDEVQVSYTNPVYYGNAYRNEDDDALNRAKQKLADVLGMKKEFGTGDKKLSEKKLHKYHYMFGMEYFDDPSELASYDDQEEAIAAVEEGLAKGRGDTMKVYRIDIPGKDETVFGVALTNANDCSGDEYIMSRVDKAPLRSTGHLPYEILVSDGEVYALYARFRIAISWPHLPMIHSDTGATFFNIMCAPNAIEEALIDAAGGEV